MVAKVVKEVNPEFPPKVVPSLIRVIFPILEVKGEAKDSQVVKAKARF